MSLRFGIKVKELNKPIVKTPPYTISLALAQKIFDPNSDSPGVTAYDESICNNLVFHFLRQFSNMSTEEANWSIFNKHHSTSQTAPASEIGQFYMPYI